MTVGELISKLQALPLRNLVYVRTLQYNRVRDVQEAGSVESDPLLGRVFIDGGGHNPPLSLETMQADPDAVLCGEGKEERRG